MGSYDKKAPVSRVRRGRVGENGLTSGWGKNGLTSGRGKKGLTRGCPLRICSNSSSFVPSLRSSTRSMIGPLVPCEINITSIFQIDTLRIYIGCNPIATDCNR